MLILLRTQVERTAKTPVTPVAPVSAVCAAFAAQPSAYPPNTRKPDVAPTCGSIGKTSGCNRTAGERRPLHGGCGSSAVKCKIERFWTLRRKGRTKPRGRARPAAATTARRAGSFGDLRGGC